MSIQISRNNQLFGSIEFQQLVAMMQAGQLLPSDSYWHPGVNQWFPLQTMPELQGVLQCLFAQSADQTTYYLFRNGANEGPYGFKQLAAALQTGHLRSSDSVFRSDLQSWSTFTQFEEFAPYLSTAATTNNNLTATQTPQKVQSTHQITTRSCGVCGGSGKTGFCPNCHGTGNERTWFNTPYTGVGPIDEKIKNYANKKCSMCAGTGATECSRCGGSGRETVLA